MLIGSSAKLDYLASLYEQDSVPHPLQLELEDIIKTQLDDDEQEIFYMRFGEMMTVRAIAAELGYTYHSYVQRILERIEAKVRMALITDIGMSR